MSAKDVGAVKASHDSEVPTMQAVTTIGLDIAKSVFQVHGVDAEGRVLIRRQLKRRYVLAFFQKRPPCLVVSRPAQRRYRLAVVSAALERVSKSRTGTYRRAPFEWSP
jgi:transposase